MVGQLLEFGMRPLDIADLCGSKLGEVGLPSVSQSDVTLCLVLKALHERRTELRDPSCLSAPVL